MSAVCVIKNGFHPSRESIHFMRCMPEMLEFRFYNPKSCRKTQENIGIVKRSLQIWRNNICRSALGVCAVCNVQMQLIWMPTNKFLRNCATVR